VRRQVVTTIPPRVEYSLTPLGVEVAVRVRDLAELLEGAAIQIAESRAAYLAR
jgi:DNA-binding HxlR family transcriptional regulator